MARPVTPKDLLVSGVVRKGPEPFILRDEIDYTNRDCADLELTYPQHRTTLPDDFAISLREIFQTHGLCVIRKLITEEVTAQILQGLKAALIPSLEERISIGEFPAEHVQRDDVDYPGTLKQIQQLANKSVAVGTLVDSRLAPIARAVLGEPVILKNVQYFDKPPTDCYAPGKGSKATPPHQDAFYFMLDPPHQACTIWLALDNDINEETGCLYYERSSHTDGSGVRPHGASDVMGFSQALLDYAPNNPREVPIPCSAGDMIVHHARTAHRAGPNTSSSRHRRAIGAIFYAKSARVDEARHAAKQLEIHQKAATLEGQQQQRRHGSEGKQKVHKQL